MTWLLRHTAYYMYKKKWPILYSSLLYKISHHFLDICYFWIDSILFLIYILIDREGKKCKFCFKNLHFLLTHSVARFLCLLIESYKLLPNTNGYYLIFQETPSVDSLQLFAAVSARSVRILFHLNFHSWFLDFSDIPRVFSYPILCLAY